MPFWTVVSALSAVCGIRERVDNYTFAVHIAVPRLACSFLADLSFCTSNFTFATVIEVGFAAWVVIVTRGSSSALSEDACQSAVTDDSVSAAVERAVRLAPVHVRIVLCNMVISLATLRDTGALMTASCAPSGGLRAVCGLFTAGGFRIRHAGIVRDVIIFNAGCNQTCAVAAFHGLSKCRHFVVAVVSALAAVRRAGVDIGTFAVAKGIAVEALVAAFATSTEQIGIAFDAFRAATRFCILHTFASAGIDVKAVDALQDLALALYACARLPAGDGCGAGTVMQTAVFNRIELAGIVVGVHAVNT